MKLQVFSDLHVDVHPIKPISIIEGVDVVVVAGDTCEGAVKAFEHLRRIVPIEIPIVMTLGNHEYYRRFIPDELALAHAHAPAFNVHVLENETVTIGGDSGIQFIGATLWTNYEAFGEAKKTAAMNACASGMNDHRLIGWQKQPWRRFSLAKPPSCTISRPSISSRRWQVQLLIAVWWSAITPYIGIRSTRSTRATW
jgi:hypothetical protein